MSAPTPQRFTEASRTLQAARLVYRDFANALANAKFDLETKKAQHLAEGVEGKNQEQREAALRQVLGVEYEKVHKAETDLNDVRTDLDNAQTVWDCLRYQLRLAEVDVLELKRAA